MKRGVVLFLILLLPFATPTAADPMRLERSDPEHLRALNRPLLPKEVIPPRTRFTRSQVVYSFPDAMTQFARFDAALSRLCQRGAFIQQTEGFYAARTPDKRYGVAFSGGANLDDAQNQRRPGQVYFFDGQDSRCKVYVGDQATLMKHYTPPAPR